MLTNLLGLNNIFSIDNMPNGNRKMREFLFILPKEEWILIYPFKFLGGLREIIKKLKM